MVDIHDQRPVALTPDLAGEWLDPDVLKERTEKVVLHLSEPAEVFEWFQFNTVVGNVPNKYAKLINNVLIQAWQSHGRS